jgi:maltooligosyltrehalose trehalohydrolase
VAVHITAPEDRLEPLAGDDRGYYETVLEGVGPGTDYLFRLDGRVERPDPASRSQPQGVHAPSRVAPFEEIEPVSGWFGLPLSRYVIYELHVGTFSPEGTFSGVARGLDRLRDLGVTAVELMPVARFPGDRNWGYDGVYPFAVQDSYGGMEGLRSLVRACHDRGLAVILDVVYNHLGPEGNYLSEFGPYFTDRYHTPWGLAVNFDGPHSGGVRDYFIQNALYWIEAFGIDALRLDAVHAIKDFSARPFLLELAEAVDRTERELDRRVHLIAESSLNDTRLIRLPEQGGFGLDAQWNDDFHHAVHTLLTGEREGYYEDFGRIEHLALALDRGFVYTGQHSAFRRRRHGNPSGDLPGDRFVVSIQNHDQVGNRMQGDRLSGLVGFGDLKLAAGLMLLSPNIPLLFMGEEYGETAPFPYFISHTDPDLVEAVRKGRKEEFRSFQWSGTPPDPFDEATFRAARLDPTLAEGGRHRALNALYRRLLELRRTLPPLEIPDEIRPEVREWPGSLLTLHRRRGEEGALAIFHLGREEANFRLDLPPADWRLLLDSEGGEWMESEPGGEVRRMDDRGLFEVRVRPRSFMLLHRSGETSEPWKNISVSTDTSTSRPAKTPGSKP